MVATPPGEAPPSKVTPEIPFSFQFQGKESLELLLCRASQTFRPCLPLRPSQKGSI